MAPIVRSIFVIGTIVFSLGTVRCYDVTDKQYRVNNQIKALLDRHSHEIAHAIDTMKKPRKKYRDGVWQFPWLPGYFIKYDLERIEGMVRIKRCIQEHNLSLITLPDKRIYHIKGRPREVTNENYVVVVNEIIQPPNPQPLTLEHVRQLSTIIQETSYVDITGTNYIRLANGQLCLIDTEGSFDRKRLIRGYLRLIGTTHNLNTDYTPDALMFLFTQIRDLIKEDPSIAPFAFMRLEEYFARQKRPLAWDYIFYWYELMSRYIPSREAIMLARSQAFNSPEDPLKT